MNYILGFFVILFIVGLYCLFAYWFSGWIREDITASKWFERNQSAIEDQLRPYGLVLHRFSGGTFWTVRTEAFAPYYRIKFLPADKLKKAILTMDRAQLMRHIDRRGKLLFDQPETVPPLPCCHDLDNQAS